MLVVQYESESKVTVHLPLKLCAGLVPNIRRVALLAFDLNYVRRTRPR